jgi:hypothetical protein
LKARSTKNRSELQANPPQPGRQCRPFPHSFGSFTAEGRESTAAKKKSSHSGCPFIDET